MLPFFGASVYDDPAVYAKSSPIEFIKKVKTPTLVLHGDRDSEVPTPQGYEFWHALKTLGVPTQLVIYEDEGHGIQRPEAPARHRPPRASTGSTSTWQTKVSPPRRSIPDSSPALDPGDGRRLRARARDGEGVRVVRREGHDRRAERRAAGGGRGARSRAAAREGGEVDAFAADVREPDAGRGAGRPRRRALRQGRRPRQQRRRQLPRALRGPDAERLRRRRAHRPLRLRATARSRSAGTCSRARRPGAIVSIVDDLRVDRHGLRAALGLRQGGRPRHDALARRRVGPRRHPPERDRARADPDGGRLLAPHGRTPRRRRTRSAASRSAASARRRRSRTSRRSSSRTSARTRPATASRWTAASGSRARASSRTTGSCRARRSRGVRRAAAEDEEREPTRRRSTRPSRPPGTTAATRRSRGSRHASLSSSERPEPSAASPSRACSRRARQVRSSRATCRTREVAAEAAWSPVIGDLTKPDDPTTDLPATTNSLFLLAANGPSDPARGPRGRRRRRGVRRRAASCHLSIHDVEKGARRAALRVARSPSRRR